MRFSVSVTPRSERLKNDMQSFLRREYRTWPSVQAEPETLSNFSHPVTETELGRSGKYAIGFIYGQVSGSEREYHYALLRWVALQIGRRRSSFRAADLSIPAPYLLFDGSEVQPVLRAEDRSALPEAFRQATCDNLGMLTHHEEIVRELAWYHIPAGSYERVSLTHQGRPVEEIEAALVEAGLEGGRQTLQAIQKQIERLNYLWANR